MWRGKVEALQITRRWILLLRKISRQAIAMTLNTLCLLWKKKDRYKIINVPLTSNLNASWYTYVYYLKKSLRSYF